MAYLVVKNAMLSCNQGTTPATFTAINPMVTCAGLDVATVNDNTPVNLGAAGFGMCQSMANPAVASATAAAQGTLTPQKCMPNCGGPWTPGSMKLTVKGAAALLDSDMLMCAWAGTIQVDNAGQVKCEVAG